MKRKIIITVCCAILLCVLSGCQLARENAGINANEDKLIGVFITREYIDLFDFESYLNNNINSYQDGEIIIDRNTKNYQGRIYAALVPRTLTSEETGEETIIQEYIFEGISGIPYCVPTMQATEEENCYVSTASDAAISDGHTNINVGDDVNSITLDGTLYVAPSSTVVSFYLNPVYQSTDGSVYLVSGEGNSFSGLESEGLSMSQTMDAVHTSTENGKVKTDSVSITISISVMFTPEKIVILQMNADNELISRSEFKPEAIPDSFEPKSDAVYFIVESHKRDSIGNINISREIFGKDAENIETFFTRDDGICIKHGTQVHWE